MVLRDSVLGEALDARQNLKASLGNVSRNFDSALEDMVEGSPASLPSDDHGGAVIDSNSLD